MCPVSPVHRSVRWLFVPVLLLIVLSGFIVPHATQAASATRTTSRNVQLTVQATMGPSSSSVVFAAENHAGQATQAYLELRVPNAVARNQARIRTSVYAGPTSSPADIAPARIEQRGASTVYIWDNVRIPAGGWFVTWLDSTTRAGGSEVTGFIEHLDNCQYSCPELFVRTRFS